MSPPFSSRTSAAGATSLERDPSGLGASPAPGGTHALCPTCQRRYPADYRACPQDGVALVLADDLVGTTLSGSYRLVRILGEGGMGRVYEACHTRIAGKRFAIKTLHPEFAAHQEVLARFQREAEAAASIPSVHVVGVYDVDRTQDGRPFMVAEYLEGEELFERLRKVGRLPIPAAVRIVRQICSALAAAHSIGVVHRDMKPENVFLIGDAAAPTVKVIDFGISKVADSGGAGLTQTGMIMGTPSFMSPEQARGEHVDHRADIYAVGAILYTLLTGTRPFDRSEPTATLMAVLTEDPPRPRSLEANIPQALELCVQRAMAKRPEDRQQTIEELDAALAPHDTHRATSTDRLAPARARLPNRAATVVAGTGLSARGVLWILFGFSIAALGTGLMTAIGGAMRASRDGAGALTLVGSEPGWIVVSVCCALAIPTAFALRRARRTLREHADGALNLVASLTGPVLMGAAAYGFGSLLVRVVEAIVLQRAAGIAWPAWDLLLFVVGATVAACVALYPRLEALFAR